MITGIPLALILFITPWIADARKLSELDFIVSLYTPTVLGFLARICSAIKSLRTVFDLTTASIIV